MAGLLTRDPDARTARILSGMLEGEVDRFLEELTLNVAFRETARHGPTASDPADQHLWDLLVTGDRRLLESRVPAPGCVLSPASYPAMTGAV